MNNKNKDEDKSEGGISAWDLILLSGLIVILALVVIGVVLVLLFCP